MSEPKACELCGDFPKNMALVSRCHTFSPLRVEKHGDELVLYCFLPECNREVGRFKLAHEVQH